MQGRKPNWHGLRYEEENTASKGCASMNLNRFLIKVFIAGVAAIGVTASAAPLSGAVSTVGTLCLGSSPGNPACTQQDVSTLRYFDYIHGGAGGLDPSPGTPSAISRH
jgi:hypothetical protein